VDAKKELGILLDGDESSVNVLELLTLVEIGEFKNIASDDAYLLWTKDESVYTLDFLRVMLPLSAPPRRIHRKLLLQIKDEKEVVELLMKSSTIVRSSPPPYTGETLSSAETITEDDDILQYVKRFVYKTNDRQYLRTVKHLLETVVGQETIENEIISFAALLAAKEGSLMTLEWLMNCYPEIVPFATDENGSNILMVTVKNSVIEWILDDDRVDIDAINIFEETAVGCVSLTNTEPILRLLVDKGGANMADLKNHTHVSYIVKNSNLETLKWIFSESNFPNIDLLVVDALGGAIHSGAVDKVEWMIEEGKSIVTAKHLLLALKGPDFTIARWLISSPHVDAMEQFRIILHGGQRFPYRSVPRLLRFIEIGEFDNIEKNDSDIMWTMADSVYTTEFLEIMLPRSDPPDDIRKQLINDEKHKDLVHRGLELRTKLRERPSGLMKVLEEALPPNVLRQKVIDLEKGRLSTKEMWNTILSPPKEIF
jgi:hypothetical protein